MMSLMKGQLRLPHPGTAPLLCALLLAVQAIHPVMAAQNQAPDVSIPEAPAGGLDPSKLPDIQGIHLGMTPDQALPKFKALSTFTPLRVTPGRYATVSNDQWPVYVLADAGPPDDTISGTFSSPPNKQVLVRIERTLNFAVGKQPTVETIKAALFQKYGPNGTQTNPMTWVWTFNETGGPMASPPPVRQLQSCDVILSPGHGINSFTSPGLPLSPQYLKQWMTMKCFSPGVYVKASFFGSSLNVVISDTAEDFRDVIAGELYIEKSDTAKQQNVGKDTKRNVPAL